MSITVTAHVVGGGGRVDPPAHSPLTQNVVNATHAKMVHNRYIIDNCLIYIFDRRLAVTLVDLMWSYCLTYAAKVDYIVNYV